MDGRFKSVDVHRLVFPMVSSMWHFYRTCSFDNIAVEIIERHW